MTITQTIEIPDDRRLIIDVPRKIPTGAAIITFTPALPKDVLCQRTDIASLPGGNARTIEEALKMAEAKASDPNRKPISRLFGKHKGIFGGDGVAYQRAIRDEWD